MGFLKKLFSKADRTDNKEQADNQQEEASGLHEGVRTGKQISYDPDEDSDSFIADHCEQILETVRQLEEIKTEYQAVTSYLTDMQKIDRIPAEEREELNDIARKIITLTRERAKYQNNTKKITDVQYKNIARYEEVIPDELKKMMKNEAYYATVKNDMRHLEGEKGSLNYQLEETVDNQSYLRKMAITACILVSLLFLLFMVVENVFHTNIQIPFAMTVIMGLVSAVYIIKNSTANKRELKIVERKLNRAITLLNKVKIKFVNKTNELDYAYQKYMVNSYAELNYLWEQYQKAKEEEKHYRINSEELESCNRQLVRELKGYTVADPDIWVYQAVAIIDNNEMVEVRHRLNVRRQKLRERIDYNNALKERSMDAIGKFIGRNPDRKGEIVTIVSKFGIEL